MIQRNLALGPTSGFLLPVAAKVAELVQLPHSPLATWPGKPTSTCTAIRLRVPREITAAFRTGQVMKHQYGMYQAHGVELGFLLLFAPEELQVLILELGVTEVRALLEEIQAARHLVLVLAGGEDVVGAVAATLPSANTEWIAAAKQAGRSDALQFFSAFASFSRYIAEAVTAKEISAIHGRFAAVRLHCLMTPSRQRDIFRIYGKE